MYLLEMHCHCAPVSLCASITPEEEIAKYKAAGYSGIVSTNHINRSTFRDMEEKTWEEKTAYFLSAYEKLCRCGREADIDVLLACEINLTPKGWPEYIPNDYLVYGITEEWLYALGDPRDLTLHQLKEKTAQSGLLLIHAHPFRTHTVIADERDLDGVEIYNGNEKHDSHDFLAALWARRKGLIQTSGSDLHHAAEHIRGGIRTKERIRTNAELLLCLREGNCGLIVPEAG